jgi:hypothetical protein
MYRPHWDNEFDGIQLTSLLAIFHLISCFQRLTIQFIYSYQRAKDRYEVPFVLPNVAHSRISLMEHLH